MHPKFFATQNQNKLREINNILGYELEQISIDLLEPQEVDAEASFRKNEGEL